MFKITVEGSIVVPFHFRFFCLTKCSARMRIKNKLRLLYPTGKIRWLRVVRCKK